MRILKIKTRGMKNLYENITLSFCNSRIENGIKKLNRVKGIYGYNGSGKTAFISSVALYKTLLVNRKYLLIESNQLKLNNLINKKIKEFYFEIVFMDEQIKQKNPTIFRHILVLKHNDFDNAYYLHDEKFEKLLGQSIDIDKFETIYSKNDNVNPFDINDDYHREFLGLFLKKNQDASILSEYLSFLSQKIADKKYDIKTPSFIFELALLQLSLLISRLPEDTYKEIEILRKLEDLKKAGEIESIELKHKINSIVRNFYFDNKKIIVPIKEFGQFEKQTIRLLNFIKIFKPELLNIEIDKSIDNKNYVCSYVMVYRDYKVDLQFESAGIKKLVGLHSNLQGCVLGLNTFIDEIDTNINSVYLEKLIEFLRENCKGQICFTTHNLDTMDILKKQGGAISCFGLNNKVDTWIINGNSSAKNAYKTGKFDFSPFNSDENDFLLAFELGDK